MRFDFSVWQRAEDKWSDARRAAEEQRHIRRAEEQIGRTERQTQPAAPRFWFGLAARLRRWLAGLAGFMAFLLALLIGQVGAASLTDAARNLAENVLGIGTVKAVRISDENQTVNIRWESATYRPTSALPEARALLATEAEFATAAILGRLSSVVRVRFTMVSRGRILATGENHRARGIWLAYSPSLGGGATQTAPLIPATGGSVHRKL